MLHGVGDGVGRRATYVVPGMVLQMLAPWVGAIAYIALLLMLL